MSFPLESCPPTSVPVAVLEVAAVIFCDLWRRFKGVRDACERAEIQVAAGTRIIPQYTRIAVAGTGGGRGGGSEPDEVFEPGYALVLSFPEQVFPKIVNGKHLVWGETFVEKGQKPLHRNRIVRVHVEE